MGLSRTYSMAYDGNPTVVILHWRRFSEYGVLQWSFQTGLWLNCPTVGGLTGRIMFYREMFAESTSEFAK